MKENDTKHKYSTYLIFILFIAGGFTGAIGLTSRDIDDVCYLNDSFLYKYNGVWTCSKNLTFEEDLRFPVSSILVRGASNVPDYEMLQNNTYVLAFSSSIMEQAFLILQLPHGRNPISPLEFHFHWTGKKALTGNVTFCLEFTCANIDEAFTNTTIKCVNDEFDGVYKHQMTNYITVNGVYNRSAMCATRVYRDPTNSTDTYNADALLLEVDVHYNSTGFGMVEQ